MSDDKSLSRRRFLKAASVLGTGSLVWPRWVHGQSGSQPSARDSLDSHVVPTRPFGRTGAHVSCLSLGGMFDIPSNQLLLRQAVRWGVTHWDTASTYGGGRSEEGIGQFFERHPETRKEIFLVTKSEIHRPQGMTDRLNRSLNRMKTDYVDLYFVHGVRNLRGMDAEMKAWAEKAKSQGKIRFFGFSTHSNMEECMLDAARLGWIDGIMMTYNFRLMHEDRMKRAVDACAGAGIGLTAMKTQGGGSVSMETEGEMRMAGRFLQAGFTDRQARLMAVWEEPRIANICSQMPNLTILMSNVAAALNRTGLTRDDKESLKHFASETASGYCAGCSRICEGAMNHEVPVQDVMRCLMYYRSYGDSGEARRLFAAIPEMVRSRMGRLDYSPAEQRCPQKMPIGVLMKDALSILA